MAGLWNSTWSVADNCFKRHNISTDEYRDLFQTAPHLRATSFDLSSLLQSHF